MSGLAAALQNHIRCEYSRSVGVRTSHAATLDQFMVCLGKRRRKPTSFRVRLRALVDTGIRSRRDPLPMQPRNEAQHAHLANPIAQLPPPWVETISDPAQAHSASIHTSSKYSGSVRRSGQRRNFELYKRSSRECRTDLQCFTSSTSRTSEYIQLNPRASPSPVCSVLSTHAYFGLATDVVSDPLSTYTPLKNQSSAPVPSLPERGRRSTPKCQSAPLLDVLAENGPAVLTSVLLPVECQKETC